MLSEVAICSYTHYMQVTFRRSSAGAEAPSSTLDQEDAAMRGVAQGGCDATGHPELGNQQELLLLLLQQQQKGKEKQEEQ